MRPETLGEIRVDGAVHVIGLGAALVAVGLLLNRVLAGGDPLVIVAALIYAFGLLCMLGLSAAYNLMRCPIKRGIVRKYDHAAIFVMIAGTYTPFALLSLSGFPGYGLLIVTWLIAIAGVLLKLVRPGRFEKTSVALYLALGWVGLPAVPAMLSALPDRVLVLLSAGAILYTVGVAFHLWESLKFQNAIWHAFVLLAAGCHYVAVLQTVSL